MRLCVHLRDMATHVRGVHGVCEGVFLSWVFLEGVSVCCVYSVTCGCDDEMGGHTSAWVGALLCARLLSNVSGAVPREAHNESVPLGVWISGHKL